MKSKKIEKVELENMNIGIGVDIGGTHIVSSAVNLETGEPIAGTQFEKDVDCKASKELIFETWAEPINQTITAVNNSTITGVGFGMPGAFNYRTGIAQYESNDKYEQLFDVNVLEEFPKYIKAENLKMRFINDATAFAVGTAWFGKAKGYDKSIALTLGTGFGSCFIENEIPIVDGATVPDHGCFWYLPFKDGIADDYFSTRWFVNAYEKLSGETVKGVKEVVERAKTDKKAMNLFVQFGENLAEFLSPWLMKFEPGILVLGGNVSKSMPLFEVAFLEVLQKNNIELKVVHSNLLEEAAISGSAKTLDDNFWNRIKDNLPTK